MPNNDLSIPDAQDRAKPSYYAVRPAKVRYDETLRPNAKLLYAEITALTSARGYCWASNERLGEFFGLAPKTVGSLIQQLAERGYLAVEMVRNESRAITGRRIWIDRPNDLTPPLLKNEDTPLKNEDTPLLKNEEESIKSDIINPPAAPQGAASVPKWKPERFAGLWTYYPRHTSKQAAAKAWDKLKPADELIAEIGKALRRQKACDEWQRGIGIPHLATYLNQRRWEDELDEQIGGPPRASAPTEEAELPWI